jgi:hypothetical protein
MRAVRSRWFVVAATLSILVACTARFQRERTARTGDGTAALSSGDTECWISCTCFGPDGGDVLTTVDVKVSDDACPGEIQQPDYSAAIAECKHYFGDQVVRVSECEYSQIPGSPSPAPRPDT